MKRKYVGFLIGMVLTVITVLGICIEAKAFDKPAGLQAIGRFDFDYDNSGVTGDHPSDFVYDAEDIYYLYKLCE